MNEHEIVLAPLGRMNELRMQCSCGSWLHAGPERISLAALAHLQKALGQYERCEVDGEMADVIKFGPLILTARLPESS